MESLASISATKPVKILRFLQEGEFRPLGTNETTRVDVRVLAATHRDLRAEVRAGRFREDLYFRLTGMVLSIPPLRSRPADIHVLVQHLLDAACARHGRHVRGLAPGVMDVLVRYAWPGNVRELQNEILRMLVLAEGDSLGLDLLSPMLMGGEPVCATSQIQPVADARTHETGTLQERMDALEADVLMETIARCGWNKSLTARELGLSRVGLRAKLERYGIVPDAGKQSLQKGNS